MNRYFNPLFLLIILVQFSFADADCLTREYSSLEMYQTNSTDRPTDRGDKKRKRTYVALVHANGNAGVFSRHHDG